MRTSRCLLNQSEGGIYISVVSLAGLVEDGRRRDERVERVRLGLQHGLAASLDLFGAGRQAGEEGLDVRADLGGGAKASVGGDFLADPAPDVLMVVNLLHVP